MLEVELKTSDFMMLSILLLWHVHLLAFLTFGLCTLASLGTFWVWFNLENCVVQVLEQFNSPFSNDISC